MPTQDEIYEKVQATLVDALGVDEDDVTRASTLQGDLGAESIDFLDIVFRLERNFGIKIPRGELFPENVISDPEMISGGKLTSKGLDFEEETAMVHETVDLGQKLLEDHGLDEIVVGPSAEGRHRYLQMSEHQRPRALEALVQLSSQPPSK